jgi:hypothetical protein
MMSAAGGGQTSPDGVIDRVRGVFRRSASAQALAVGVSEGE